MMTARNEATARSRAGHIQAYRPLGAAQNPFAAHGNRSLSTCRPPLFPVARSAGYGHFETDFRGIIQPRKASLKARILGAFLAIVAVLGLMTGLTSRLDIPNTLLAAFGVQGEQAEIDAGVGAVSEKTLIRPVRRGRISSRFGLRWGRMHQGVDIAARYGEPIHALAAGRVVHSGWESGYGRSIVIDHGNGLQTRYAHCARLRVPVGAAVTRDDWIADVGATGHATGPHLHLEVLVKGMHKNPAGYYRMGPPSPSPVPSSESQLAQSEKSESGPPLLAWLGRSGRNMQAALLALMPHDAGQPDRI